MSLTLTCSIASSSQLMLPSLQILSLLQVCARSTFRYSLRMILGRQQVKVALPFGSASELRVMVGECRQRENIQRPDSFLTGRV